jgi:MYXO-CTERM domain-containing protein
MTVKRLRELSLCSLIVASGLYASRASAHATPHVIDMLFPENGYVLVSNRGLIFGDQQRTQWRLMCAEALDINTSEQPSLVALPGGKLLVGTSQGLSSSSDQGCNWLGVEPFATTSVPALVRDPHATERLYLAAYSNEADDKGGLYVSEDAGKSWQKLLAADQRDYVRSIRVAPSDAKRIYASGQSWDEMGKYAYYVTRSNDGGKTWERMPVALNEDELELGLYEVQPNNPDVITAHAGNRSPMSAPDRLLVSRDAGKSWNSPLAITLLSALTFSADGSKAWVVGQDGLYESSDNLASFQKLGAAISLSYVTERDGKLLVAGYYSGLGPGGNGIGMLRAQPDMYDSFMQLSDVTEPVACDAASKTAATCASWWMDWQRELGSGQFAPDAGVPMDAGNAAGAPVAGSGGAVAGSGGSVVAGMPPMAAGTGSPGAGSGGGCSVAGGPARGLGLGMLVGLALAWLRRRR